MTALGMILKSMGIMISDEQRAQIEILIPQIPSRVVQCVEVINAAVAKVNENTASIQNLVTVSQAQLQAYNTLAIQVGLLRDTLQEMKENGRRNNPEPAIGTEPEPGTALNSSGRYLAGNPAKRKRAHNGTA